MPQCSWESSVSYDRFEIRSHDPVDATHFRESVNFIDCGAFVSQRVLQGFDGDVNADLVTVFETVGNRLRGAVDSDRNTFNRVRNDPLGERFSGKTNDAEGWRFQRWTACLIVYRDPDLVWVLGREAMKPERGKEANHAVRSDLGHDSKREVLAHRRVNQSVYSSRRPAQQALPIHTKKVLTRNSPGFQVA